MSTDGAETTATPRSAPWVPVVLVVAIGVAALGSDAVLRNPVLVALAIASLASWLASVLLGAGRLRTATLVAAVALGAVGAGLGASLLMAPLLAALILLIGDLRVPAVAAAAAVLGAALAVAGVAAASGRTFLFTGILLAGVAFAALGGAGRRARRAAEVRERALVARSAAAERDAARAALLEERSAAAREVHDVLAHGLGGLVVQLDAIEALLEHGRVPEAAERAASARRLAGESLAEARRAVTALRDPGTPAAAPLPDTALADLVAVHRDLGGAAEVQGDLQLDGVDEAHRAALVRALQEGLSNARRHGAGAVIRIALLRDGDGTRLTIRTASAGRGSPAGGHGLQGMRERFAALGDGSSADAREDGPDFVVTAVAR